MFKNVGQVSVDKLHRQAPRPTISSRTVARLDQGQEPERAGSDKGDREMKFDRRRKRTLKSLALKKSVSINGHSTSVNIEGAFWNAFEEIAVGRNISANALVSKIDSERQVANLSSAIRVYVVEHYRLAANANARKRSTPPPADDPRQHARVGRARTPRVILIERRNHGDAPPYFSR